MTECKDMQEKEKKKGGELEVQRKINTITMKYFVLSTKRTHKKLTLIHIKKNLTRVVQIKKTTKKYLTYAAV